MSRLKELIERLCPDGVEFSPLKNIAIIKNGKDYKHCGPGDIPVYGSGGIMTYIDQFCYDKPTVLLPRKGSIGKIYYVETPFWNVDTVYYTDINTTKVCPKFLYYFLATIDLEKMNCGKGAVPSLTQEILYRIIIPVPPIEVQEEIVRILDRFADYAASLQAELQARKEQYEYYRNLLLTFNPSACGCGTDGEQEIKVTTCGGDNYKVIWKAMGEIGKFFGGLTGKSKSDFTNGNARFISYMNVYSNIALNQHMDEYVCIGKDEKQNTLEYGDSIFTGSSETPDECGMSSVVTMKPTEPLYLNSFCFGFRLNDKTLFAPDFLKHLLRSKSIRSQIAKTANGVTRFNVSKVLFAKIVLPIPPYELQVKIASILDRFEALVNDLTQGLPAEIAAVRERYEYYRNKLLTFKRIA